MPGFNASVKRYWRAGLIAYNREALQALTGKKYLWLP
jgi:hypothetical protein